MVGVETGLEREKLRNTRRETAHLALPYANINSYSSLEKCWLRGGVGGQFPRNVVRPQNSSFSFPYSLRASSP